MRRLSSATAIAIASGALCGLAGSAIAAASGKSLYEAGRKAAPPYALVTVSHGKVATVRWKMRESCEGSPYGFFTGLAKLNAPIKHGHFSKTVHYKIGSSALGTSTGTTTIKGTISGGHAKLTVKDVEEVVSVGTCNGSRTFMAVKTDKFR